MVQSVLYCLDVLLFENIFIKNFNVYTTYDSYNYNKLVVFNKLHVFEINTKLNKLFFALSIIYKNHIYLNIYINEFFS